MKKLKEFFQDFELYLGSVFISITILVVIMNVFTRYVLKFTYFWAEEVAVGCFVWTIFLGTAAAYRKKALIGVEAIVVLLPQKVRKFVQFIVYILMTVISGVMCYFGFQYVYSSSKITAALEISYSYINSAIVLSFGLMTFYSIIYTIQSLKELFFTTEEN
ncbi:MULTISPECIES: TRAP transporter small permease [Fusobacterium]|jgi:TRAP-type C4-dicarboxylate transport system permease small subunit|uniref:TRAP transporter small permease n=1 Tax=Fusobacterium hominis TaxID=2764326 RepID=A0A7G9GZD8_9FUSO|nr:MULTISPECIES: TRAP transporter small permease [Fusobacterium]QNM16170.1 TRAP transporter small permease [Fusobacterium hominis]